MNWNLRSVSVKLLFMGEGRHEPMSWVTLREIRYPMDLKVSEKSDTTYRRRNDR